MDATPDHSTPLAKAFRLKELAGWLSKQIVIPQNRQGIILLGNAPARFLPPGKHAALSKFERVSGRGAELLAGYIPTQPFRACLKATNMLSGDEELMDASLVGLVDVTDPACFFTQFVQPNQVINEASMELSGDIAIEGLAALVSRYEAADLMQGLPTFRLATEIQTQLNPALANQGIRLIGLEMLSFRRTADQVKVAQKVQELEARLREVSMEGKMAEMEDNAKLEDFSRQIRSELVEHAGIREVTPTEVQSIKATAIPLIAQLQSKLSSLKPSSSSDRNWRIGRLFHRSQPAGEEPHPGRRQIRQWLIGRGITLLVLILVGFFITALIMSNSKEPSWSIRWEFMLIIWGPILAVVIQSLIAFLKKREEISEALWTAQGMTFIDDLSRGNRKRTDQLVREQCAGELQLIRETLVDVRSRVYKGGDENQALQIKQLEGKVENCRTEVLNPSFGAPPYLSDLKIDRHMWGHLLDYDEKLLVHIASSSLGAHNIQQKLVVGGSDGEDLTRLEKKIDAFRHDFSMRQNAVKVSEQDLQKFEEAYPS